MEADPDDYRRASGSSPSQVGTLCVERGHLLALVWAALRSLVGTALADRDTARAAAVAARRAATLAAAERDNAVVRTEAERGELSNMVDLLNRWV
jgi:hypothetical protein